MNKLYLNKTEKRKMRGLEPPLSEICNTALTLIHIVTTCRRHSDARTKSSISDTMTGELGDDENIMKFIK